MKLWVTGAGGMLGKRVVAAAWGAGHTVAATTRWQCPLDDLGIILRHVQNFQPDAIINCAGALPETRPLDMVVANALGPHNLAYAGVRLVHMSTDCVYAGSDREHNQWLTPQDLPNPDTLYGRTKLAGEPSGPHVLVVRGSFIGPEHGFLRWLLDSQGKEIEVWEEAWWNGSTAVEMARALVVLAEGQQTGTIHAAGIQRITKAAMAELLCYKLQIGATLVPVETPKLSRVLHPDYELPSFSATLPDLVREVKECAAVAAA